MNNTRIRCAPWWKQPSSFTTSRGSGFPPLETEVDHEDDNHNIIPGAWRADMQMHEVPHPYARNRDHQMAKIQRDYLTAYFNSAAGSVPWQERLAGLKNQV